ncbi:MAG: hypothetical protein HC797_07920 [Anaerolineales bacterium]|nr:hypothetical protein [Anaerolineales bacterium]
MAVEVAPLASGRVVRLKLWQWATLEALESLKVFVMAELRKKRDLHQMKKVKVESESQAKVERVWGLGFASGAEVIKTNGAKDCWGMGVLAPQADNKNATMMMSEKRDDFI